MNNYKLEIAYDGTDYCGWQIQPNGITIQALIQNALKVLIKEKIQIIGSGRTDSGVHALAQVANFKTSQTINLYRIVNGLNALLPIDIRIHHAEQVAEDFHAQYTAKGKIYHYHLWLDPVVNPFLYRFRYHNRSKIHLDLLQEASQAFIGTHDFTSFANEGHRGTAAHDPIRTIKRLDVIKQEGGVRLEFEGDGFLYKMVRNMVGIMLEIAEGKRSPQAIPQILAAKNRTFAGKAAPPQGLFLVKVFY